MIEDITSFGAVGDGVKDDTAALQAAAQSGRRVLMTAGTWTHTAALNFKRGTEFVGVGGVESTILKATGSGSYPQVEMPVSAEGAALKEVTLDGGTGRNSSGYGVRIRGGATRNKVIGNRFVNQPAMGILVRDGATHATIDDNWFEPNVYGPHIYLLSGVTDTKIRGNHGVDAAGFTISLHGGILRTTITGNSCQGGYGELIGVTYDCLYGTISGNHARGTGDNGISVTGRYWTVTGNRCEQNAHAGIGIYGSYNTVTGNVVHNNNRTVDTAGGIRLHAFYGGLAADNYIGGNVLVSETGVTPLQHAAVRVDGLSYVTWAPGQTIGTSSSYRIYGGRLYMAAGSGVTGATPPTHTTGTVTDGAVSWLYVTSSAGGFVPNGNIFGRSVMAGSPNNILNHVPGAPNVDDSLPAGFPAYTLATLTEPTKGRGAFVTDAPGGPIAAMADGYSWRGMNGQILR